MFWHRSLQIQKKKLQKKLKHFGIAWQKNITKHQPTPLISVAADAEARELVRGGHFIAPAPHSDPCTDAPKPTTQPHTT